MSENANLHVRFTCESAEHLGPVSITVAASDSTVLRNLEWFFTEHVHKESDSMSLASDRAALYTALSTFFSEQLPRISAIMCRRKLTFALEIRDTGRTDAR